MFAPTKFTRSHRVKKVMQLLIGRALFPTQSFICLAALAQPHYASSNAPAPKRDGPCTWRSGLRVVSGAKCSA